MAKLVQGHDLQPCLAVSEETISVTLTQENLEFKLIYFISRVLQGLEEHYSQVEKVALALLTAARRLPPYFQSYQVVVRIDHPVAKLFRKFDLAGRMVSWSVELSEFGL